MINFQIFELVANATVVSRTANMVKLIWENVSCHVPAIAPLNAVATVEMTCTPSECKSQALHSLRLALLAPQAEEGEV